MLDLQKTKEALDAVVVSVPAATLKSMVEEIERLQKGLREYECVLSFLKMKTTTIYNHCEQTEERHVMFSVDELDKLLDGVRNDN